MLDFEHQPARVKKWGRVPENIAADLDQQEIKCRLINARL